MSEWISVEDRLPEKQSWNHIAILDTKTGRISVEQDLYAIETAEKFKQKKGFCKDGRFNGREVVIAWMPFPEPPISKQVTSSKRKPATETCLFCGQVIPKWIKWEDANFCDIEVSRAPEMDKYYAEGKTEMDWSDPKDRIALVKECGFYCEEPIAEDCKDCPAKDFSDEAVQKEEE